MNKMSMGQMAKIVGLFEKHLTFVTSTYDIRSEKSSSSRPRRWSYPLRFGSSRRKSGRRAWLDAINQKRTLSTN